MQSVLFALCKLPLAFWHAVVNLRLYPNRKLSDGSATCRLSASGGKSLVVCVCGVCGVCAGVELHGVCGVCAGVELHGVCGVCVQVLNCMVCVVCVCRC